LWCGRPGCLQAGRLHHTTGAERAGVDPAPDNAVLHALNHTVASGVAALREEATMRRTMGKGMCLLALAGLALGLSVARAADGPPPGWPDYLKDFKLPAGRTWDQYRVRAKDGMPQALIPAGAFLIGSPDDDKDAYPSEKPRRQIYLSAYWIDLHPVTGGQYKKFCDATGHDMPKDLPEWNKPEHPVVMVSWDNATGYASWAGARLPSEAEYEKAARGGATTRYPWGDVWSAAMANGGNARPATTNVCSYPANGFGLYDMIGNVWEWCQDLFDAGWYKAMPDHDPVNTEKGIRRVLRGGSWNGFAGGLRVAYRNHNRPFLDFEDAGFRCAEAP
jgi:formylglycine-generating enzyme required for sulfatase activity